MAMDSSLQLGMVGLGRMGANLVRRLMRDGHRCVVYDVNTAAIDALVAEGATGASDLDDFVAKLEPPRTAWLMLPAAITGRTLDHLTSMLEPGDTVIDGGNSYYRDDIARAKALAPKQIHYIDCGTSGGVWGLDRGYCLMIGGVAEVSRRGSVVSSWRVAPAASALAKSPDLADFAGRVSDSGEGRWTVLAAVEEGVPAPVITASLYQRFESRALGMFTDKLLS